MKRMNEQTVGKKKFFTFFSRSFIFIIDFSFYSVFLGSLTIGFDQFPTSFKVCFAVIICSFTRRNSSIWRALCSCKFLSCSAIVVSSRPKAAFSLSSWICLSCSESRRITSLNEETATCWPSVRFLTCSRYWNRNDDICLLFRSE